jgi:hypothetical protein
MTSYRKTIWHNPDAYADIDARAYARFKANEITQRN